MDGMHHDDARMTLFDCWQSVEWVVAYLLGCGVTALAYAVISYWFWKIAKAHQKHGRVASAATALVFTAVFAMCLWCGYGTRFVEAFYGVIPELEGVGIWILAVLSWVVASRMPDYYRSVERQFDMAQAVRVAIPAGSDSETMRTLDSRLRERDELIEELKSDRDSLRQEIDRLKDNEDFESLSKRYQESLTCRLRKHERQLESLAHTDGGHDQ